MEENIEEEDLEEEIRGSRFKRAYLRRFQIECDSLIEYLEKGYHKRTVRRLASLRHYLDEIEAEVQDEPPAHVDEKVLVFSSKPETFLKLSFQGNLFAIDEDEMRFMKALLNLVDELEAKKKKKD